MRLASLLIAVACMACHQATIDASSKEAADRSIEAVRADLDPAKKEQFDEAMKVLVGDKLRDSMGTVFAAALAGKSVDPEAMAADIMAPLDGKTAYEVIAEAARLREKREREQAEKQRLIAEKERERVLDEIAELNQKQKKSEEAREHLAKFEVLSSRFYERKGALGMPEKIIHLKVRNGTGHPIARAFFRGTLATPGRAVPWHENDFNYNISGGLEPGESAEWNLQPNMFSGWGTAEAKPGAVFTVDVVRLEGPDGEILYEDKWTEDDAKRLTALLSKYGN